MATKTTLKNNLGWKDGDPLPDTVPEFEMTEEELAEEAELLKLLTPFGVEIPGDGPADESGWIELDEDDDDDVIAVPSVTRKGMGGKAGITKIEPPKRGKSAKRRKKV